MMNRTINTIIYITDGNLSHSTFITVLVM